MEMQDFYTDQTVLLTGATGFLGKAITEKLLRSCQNIKLLLLVRPKKGKNSTQRIQELFNDPIFNRMKSENPGYLDKVTVVGGDVAQPNIGLSDEDRAKIIENVTVVFHGAATVRFDEKLKLAVGINVLGTKQVLELCNHCRNIKAVIHISTAYANCNRKEVKEEFYAPPVPGDSMIQLTECLSEEVLDKCTPMITSGWPNTYAFTKQIAEDVIRSEAEKNSKLPIAVVRPAIVIGSHMEPLPGWIDNIYGPTGVVAGVGAGVMHVMHANSENIAELVPVDLVVNTVLAAGWDLACNRKKKKNNIEENSTSEVIEPCNNNNNNNSRNVPIYNYVSSEHNPLHWGSYMEMNIKHGIMFPSIKSMWYYTIMVTKHLPLFYLYTFFLHLLPAIIIDSVLIATAQKPQALKIYKKIQKFMTVISYFANNEWKFHDDNVQNLWNKLSKRDQAIFNFDIRVINWDRFFENNISAIRVFLFKDTPDTLPAARRKMFLLYILHRTVQIIFWSLVVYFLWSPILSSFKWLFMLSNTVATTVIRSTETSTRQLIVS